MNNHVEFTGVLTKPLNAAEIFVFLNHIYRQN